MASSAVVYRFRINKWKWPQIFAITEDQSIASKGRETMTHTCKQRNIHKSNNKPSKSISFLFYEQRVYCQLEATQKTISQTKDES